MQGDLHGLSPTAKYDFRNQGPPLTWGVDPCEGKPCSSWKFELSGHRFGTILRSNALIFQSASSSLVPLKILLVEWNKHCFLVAKHSGPQRISELGCNNKAKSIDPCRPPTCMGPFCENHTHVRARGSKRAILFGP